MKLSRHAQMAFLRAFALLLTCGVTLWAGGGTTPEGMPGSILIGYAAFFVLSSLIPGRHYVNPAIPLLLLLGDLIAIGSTGTFFERSLEPQTAFLTGYLVAVLVAVVGRSVTAGILGTLAGTMTMGLAATLFATLRQEAPDLVHLGQLTILLACASTLAATVTSWLHADAQRKQMRERLDSAVRDREREAAELVTFTQGLASSSTLFELAETTVRHLRVYLGVRARAMVLESNGEAKAIWEEGGVLTDDHIEARRSLLQDALHRVGNGVSLTSLEARSIGTRPLPDTVDFLTLVEIPVRAAGRTAGVILLGDARRGAVEEGRIGMLADIARRVGQAVQRIERQGTEEHRRTSLLLRQMREGVLLLARDGHALLANPAARQALGCEGASAPLPDRIGDATLADLAATPAGVARRFRARLQPRADRPPLQMACTAVGVLDGASRIGTLVTLSDVTEEELARARLMQSERMTLVGQTLAGVAHELNNPLTALIGFADLLRAQEGAGTPQGTLVKIQEQAVRATRIVKNLLSVARQRNPERVPVDVGEVVTSVVELFAYEARLSNVTLELDAPAPLPPVLGDGHALQQIFVNLIQNAIHAVREAKSERRITIHIQAQPDTLMATVTDSGPGVPEDLRSRVFEPFFTTKGPNKGTGLGLALSRTVAREHGGDLILDERGPPGARFVVRLPVLEAASRGTRDVQGVPLRSLDMRVLLVDDEKSVREAVVAQLGRVGCTVTSCATALEALRRLDERPFDAVLTDIRMPGTTGLELYQIAKEQDESLAPLFVFMTGDVTNEDVISEVRSTARPLLEKPFTVHDIMKVLGSLGARSAAEGEADTPPPPSPAQSERAEEAIDRVLKAW